MLIYHNLLQEILSKGVKKEDRTGTGTLSIFGYQMRFDLSDGFPLLTTKRVFIKPIIYELLWFLSGSTNIQYLHSKNVHIWDEWADEYGDLGPIYGYQWRNWIDKKGNTIDQIDKVIHSIQTNPHSRRHIVSAWNVGDIESMKLPPCHILFQFYVSNNKLSCSLYQRSADVFIGLPFNIASYSLLTQMIAHVCNLELGDFIISLGDAHIYLNHLPQVKEQLSRTFKFLPTMKINKNRDTIHSFQYEDFTLENYYSHPFIKADISV